MKPMTTRDRVQAVLNFQPFDRLPVIEWAGWWTETIDRWHREGPPAALTDRYDICRHFGLDLLKQVWFGVMRPGAPQPAGHGLGLVRNMDDYERLLPFLYQLPAVDPGCLRAWGDEQHGGDA